MRSFELVEPISTHGVPPRPFGLGQNGSALHEIVRIMVGNVDVKDQAGNVFRLRRNELRTRPLRAHKVARVVRLLFESQVNLEDYSRILTTIGARNRNFFATIRDEFLICLVARREKRFTESFLYLYRILEFTAVAFPMLYALSHQNFAGSQSFLKSLVADGKEGDLKVLSKALPTLSAQGNLDGLLFDFSIAGYDIDLINKIRAELNAAVKPAVLGMEFEEQGDILFRVPFNDMSHLFVSLRNRMFHYRNGERNIDLVRIGGAETICKICIDELIHWFCLVYTEIVRTVSRQII
ncbi:hypothetical protein [Sphingobium yanoikuyae]|uniref:hypothetical protein n=1 Tax=Sphingobium yanoikuyae TaxID=13690 RepID=UPI0012379D16|nr:hypothetical protein [Sphingobium yanoikuyae]